jgi:hypothetical protein
MRETTIYFHIYGKNIITQKLRDSRFLIFKYFLQFPHFKLPEHKYDLKIEQKYKQKTVHKHKKKELN